MKLPTVRALARRTETVVRCEEAVVAITFEPRTAFDALDDEAKAEALAELAAVKPRDVFVDCDGEPHLFSEYLDRLFNVEMDQDTKADARGWHYDGGEVSTLESHYHRALEDT